MRKLIILLVLPLLLITGFAQAYDPAQSYDLTQTHNCLRTMSNAELTRNAIWIGRVKVRKAREANYRGSFAQVAILQPVDVIEGDFTLKELNVLARSTVRCAEDNYQAGGEALVFLEPLDSLFHTVNFQYGQFPIVNEIVKGWREGNKVVDKPYVDVRRLITGYVNAAQTPRSQEPPPPPGEKPSAQKPPDRFPGL